MEIKDRIKSIMEDQKMTQQEFAEFLQQSPATLSSIFNGRTQPTLKVVDAIKTSIPDINIEWLLYGQGEPYTTHPHATDDAQEVGIDRLEPMLDFEQAPPSSGASSFSQRPTAAYSQGVKNTHQNYIEEAVKIIDKTPRKVTEIRVYYDDQTYETFVPANKK
jgi:transcriptional regulator with XRE-family HTH domain